MKNILKKIILSIFILYSLFFLVGSTLSPVVAYLHKWELSANLTALYMFSCHQQPDRSFFILGYPIALCCRCYGFYLGVIIFGILEIIDKLKIYKKNFLILISIVCLDLIINGVWKYNTGNLMRLSIGFLMGLIFVVAIKFIVERVIKLCSKKQQPHF